MQSHLLGKGAFSTKICLRFGRPLIFSFTGIAEIVIKNDEECGKNIHNPTDVPKLKFFHSRNFVLYFACFFFFIRDTCLRNEKKLFPTVSHNITEVYVFISL